MRRWILFVIVMFVSACSNEKSNDQAVQHGGVQFSDTSFVDALALAQKENKVLLVDFYRDG